ncbi:SDR family NAD(P)-dependent oxidoreductase [Streptantibioticus cattleyicolor]|uniref:Short chain dehydrogenase n=1 Tax=Streptantibioticus cattleyicolor (strain ATCC 35852 / DSM 46488 / JCM 4925 / NBRC 14057 / NRRL 8057) TaxID=1003195 RepID=F8JJG4_STREN|nr:SDR family NAD(P)-dependent oxidoreductase [Streptantibioticus cattleyicolor]AEW98711.1 short chain dehydrogenase [Streptantibioticus cattleyicolor NRRL 8057 = DSM 46488]CCB72234.1 Short-chain dehydrogenase/reductase SDR [Streptantibioticus cattleyicolor NRRL 8057 = DSM 46488]
MTVTDLFRLDDVRALITGASRGIGAAIAQAFAESGARVALAARTERATEDVAGRIGRSCGTEAHRVAGDLADPEVAPRLVDQAAHALGGLDVLVHNAGVLPTDPQGNPVLKPFARSTPEEWQPVVAVNLAATVALCRAAHRHLLESPRPSVLLVSSVAGLIGVPTMEAYGVTKAAQVSLARSLATGWAPQRIRVNALCPGWVRTDMTSVVHGDEALSGHLLRHVPMRRWADPGEVAGSAVFLTSPAASFITGQALVIDGGLSVPHGGLADLAAGPPDGM